MALPPLLVSVTVGARRMWKAGEDSLSFNGSSIGQPVECLVDASPQGYDERLRDLRQLLAEDVLDVPT